MKKTFILISSIIFTCTLVYGQAGVDSVIIQGDALRYPNKLIVLTAAQVSLVDKGNEIDGKLFSLKLNHAQSTAGLFSIDWKALPSEIDNTCMEGGQAMRAYFWKNNQKIKEILLVNAYLKELAELCTFVNSLDKQTAVPYDFPVAKINHESCKRIVIKP